MSPLCGKAASRSIAAEKGLQMSPSMVRLFLEEKQDEKQVLGLTVHLPHFALWLLFVATS